jgi:Spy/CpxP family protein refolding chaperone
MPADTVRSKLRSLASNDHAIDKQIVSIRKRTRERRPRAAIEKKENVKKDTAMEWVPGNNGQLRRLLPFVLTGQAGPFAVRPKLRRRLAMRNLSVLVTVMLAMLVCPKFAPAQESKGVGGEGVRERLAARMADLHLSDEQDTKIAEIRKECRPKVKAAAEEYAAVVKEEVEKVRALLTPEQKEKLETLKEERKEHRFEGVAARIAHLSDLDLTDAETAQIGEIREEYRPKIEKVMKELTGLLTDEQKKAREDGLKAGKSRREIRESLNLNDEQKAKMEGIGKELATVVKDELEKIKSMLTAEQQEKLPELREERKERVRDRWACRVANLSDLNLTDEQKTKIADIRQEYRPKVHEAGNKLRAAARAEVAQILAVVRG